MIAMTYSLGGNYKNRLLRQMYSIVRVIALIIIFKLHEVLEHLC
jgi:hypothetical protein